MKYLTYISSLGIACLFFVSCNKNLLDRPPQTDYIDNSSLFWRNEDDIRMFANGFYTNYFVGYNSAWGTDYTPVRGYTFSDDITSRNVQANFESNIPSSRGSTSEGAAWLQQYSGPTWDFAWVRKANIFLSRLDSVAKPKISTDAYKHWTAVARFFRGFEYSRLVTVFGDVPYFGRVVRENELDTLYKDRDPRGVVMDKVYDDFKYVLANIRENDGAQYLNKYIAAAFISSFMLFEGTFEHYHNLDAARAKKYLEFSVEAAGIVMNSNKYSFNSDFKALFSSENLAGNPEVLMYRAYDAAQTVTHHIGSYSNGTEEQNGANLDLIKSFILNDGKTWQKSALPNAGSFTIADLVKSRDPRFEASFIDFTRATSSTLLYSFKHASREAITYIGKTYPAAWGSNTNTNDAPVMRLAEVVLNWIEAKAELENYYGGPAITQADLDKSINAIRNRPLDAAAAAKGVKKTAPLVLSALPDDPSREADVPAIIWEIRRERRMEFFYEHTRLLDLKRWKKLYYMDFSRSPDYLMGPWVDMPNEIPSYLTASMKNKIRVKTADGTIVTWNGSNQSAMVGYWMVEAAANRQSFSDKNYLAPIGTQQINEYKDRGYTLTQTTGW
jgi:hypothetical protein